jgi:predicted dehydrogenase
VAGYGWVATAHIDAINRTPHAQVSAVQSSRALDPAELSATHGGEIRAYQSFARMIADPEIDVVSICSYPWQHVRQAVAAAGAGKHLILEKPLALSLADLRTLQKAVRRSGVKTCVCFECRYSSQLLTTRAVLDRGLIGRVHYAEVDYYHGIGPWYGQFRWNTKKRGGGSSLLTAGCHALDALLLFMGNDVESVSSYSTRSTNKDFKAYEYDTTSVTLLRFRDGRVGKTASVVDCLQPYTFHTHLVGSEGSMLDDKLHSTKLGGLDKDSWSRLSMKRLSSGDVSDHPYQTQFTAFFEALSRDREMPLTSLSDAVPTHEVIFAADASARSRKPVRLSSLR